MSVVVASATSFSRLARPSLRHATLRLSLDSEGFNPAERLSGHQRGGSVPVHHHIGNFQFFAQEINVGLRIAHLCFLFFPAIFEGGDAPRTHLFALLMAMLAVG